MLHPKYILKITNDERYHFNLTAKNGQVILTSQTYNSKSGAVSGIVSVQINSARDERYSRNKTSTNLYYFNLKANNGQVIGTSEMYTSSEARDNGVESVKQNGQSLNVEDQTLTIIK